MGADDAVLQGRDAYERRAWEEAYARLSAADEQGQLGAEDLGRLGMAAYLTGRIESAVAAWERTYQALMECGEVTRAVRCAFWLGRTLVLRGEQARGGGWLVRAQRVLEEASLDCVERGYLRMPAGIMALEGGDPATAYATFAEVTEIADRFGDADLMALGRMAQGRALVASGETTRGVGLLDEAMVGVVAGDVSPIAAGIVYCAVILVCRDILDLRRAREWTLALSRWCAAQPDLKPYRGQCLVHRSEIMQLRGEWADALEEVARACEHLADPPGDPVLGMAFYQRAELQRLRGELDRAEEFYRQASDCGHLAQPGLALLRLAQGRTEAALATVQRVAGETRQSQDRLKVLAAYAEIALAAGDTDAARAATGDLEQIAAEFDSPYLRAVVGYARGSLLLAEGDVRSAAAALRRAGAAWQELDAPYETARVRVAMAKACRELGDHDTAEMELDGAGRVFEQLGAAPALAEVRALASSGNAPPRTVGGLTARELEVLRLVATGASNRVIADALVISDKTVARHVANMFTKLDVSSRAAATAFAYEHGLV